MKAAYLLCLIAIMFSCKKDTNTGPPLPVNGRKTQRLKDIVVPSLPSPYYHFEYSDSGYITRLGFADAFFDYTVHYENKRVSRLININNDQELFYQYEDGRVSVIHQRDVLSGVKSMRYSCRYYPNGLLKEILWSKFFAGRSDSVGVRKVILIYNADGNLAEFDDFRVNPATEELLWSQTTEILEYDKQINVDDFSLLKDTFEDVLLLPQVRLFKNNPLRLKTSSQQNDFLYVYRYDFVNKLPVRKHLVMTQTRGGAGEMRSTTEFSYY
ncbi:MAG: hypothetical protein H7Y27_02715 [Gemmatimonadaceae bacterium]|nr:hypothetical protein [Chitinophagaceae bacterium]